MKIEFEPIAVIGYGCVFPPDSYDTEMFWKNILSGKSGIDVMPDEYWKKDLYLSKDRHEEDKTYCKFGAYVKDYKFESKINLNNEKIKKLNKSQLMLLDTVVQSLRKGNNNSDILAGSDVSIVVANMLGDYSFSNQCLINREKQIEYYLENNSEFKSISKEDQDNIKKDFKKLLSDKFSNENIDDENKIFHSNLCKGVAEILGIEGRKCIVDGACSGSLLAIDNAVKLIHTKRTKTCIVSGVLGNMGVTGNVAFAKIGGLSEVGSFPMDVSASGLIPGEGVGTIIIKSLKDAIKDNNKIFAVIRGTGVASDGKGKSIYAPSTSGQYKAMKKSLVKAGVTADYIDYIETHATGTKVGDIVELNTIKSIFDEVNLNNKKIAIGSIKSQIGHCFSAAGMANIIKVIEGFNRKLMPPTNHFERFVKDSHMNEDKRFYVNKNVKEWESEGDKPIAASVNAFGFGGINANVLVEEYNAQYHKKISESYECRLDDKVFDFSIVGIGCIDNNGDNFEEWTKNTKNGYKYSHNYPENRYPQEINQIYNNKLENIKASFIEELKFPCIKFKIPPMILGEIDKAQQMGLMVCEQIISQYKNKNEINGEKIGVYVGNMLGLETSINTDLRIRCREYVDILKNIPKFNENSKEFKDSIIKDIVGGIRKYIPKTAEDTLPGYMDNIIAGRIANYFDISGPNAVYDCDSISFGEALEQGLMSLQLRENDYVLVGGVNGNMSPEFIEMIDKLGLNNEKYIPSEGAAVFLIKRSEDVQENEHVYAKITNLDFDHTINSDETDMYEVYEEITNIDDKRMFYYGAQGAFMLLKACGSIESGEKKYISIKCKSMLKGFYELRVQAPEVPIPKIKQTEDNKVKTFKIAGQSIEDLLIHIDGEGTIDKNEFTHSKYRIEFNYNNDDDLKRKKENIKNLLLV